MTNTMQQTMEVSAAMLAIQVALDGTEWDSDTLSTIASIMIAAGYRIRDLNDCDAPDTTRDDAILHNVLSDGPLARAAVAAGWEPFTDEFGVACWRDTKDGFTFAGTVIQLCDAFQIEPEEGNNG